MLSIILNMAYGEIKISYHVELQLKLTWFILAMMMWYFIYSTIYYDIIIHYILLRHDLLNKTKTLFFFSTKTLVAIHSVVYTLVLWINHYTY